MILKRVTFTGIDRKTDLGHLISLARSSRCEVEYGILASSSSSGQKNRYPDLDFALAAASILHTQGHRYGVRVALHICGGWSRKLLQGDGAAFLECPASAGFGRLQWNINAAQVKRHKWNVAGAVRHLKAQLFANGVEGDQLIIQRHNETSVELFKELQEHGASPTVLFDASGGRGVVNSEWPEPVGSYCGYAGGFTPENVVQRVADLTKVLPVEQRIWIDMESGVRTDDWFDLDKARDVLSTLSKASIHSSVGTLDRMLK